MNLEWNNDQSFFNFPVCTAPELPSIWGSQRDDIMGIYHMAWGQGSDKTSQPRQQSGGQVFLRAVLVPSDMFHVFALFSYLVWQICFHSDYFSSIWNIKHIQDLNWYSEFLCGRIPCTTQEIGEAWLEKILHDFTWIILNWLGWFYFSLLVSTLSGPGAGVFQPWTLSREALLVSEFPTSAFFCLKWPQRFFLANVHVWEGSWLPFAP